MSGDHVSIAQILRELVKSSIGGDWSFDMPKTHNEIPLRKHLLAETYLHWDFSCHRHVAFGIGTIFTKGDGVEALGVKPSAQLISARNLLITFI